MKIRKILALLSAASMLACMTACGDDKDSSSKKEIQTETVAAEGSADESSVSDESSAESSEEVNAETSVAADGDDRTWNEIATEYDPDNAQETVMALLKKGFSTSFGENMKAEYDNATHTYDLAVWQSGFAAALDTEAGVKALDTLSSQLTSALKTMETQIQMLDSDAKLKFSFLSDKDQTTPLLVIENGEITYSAAE